MKSGATKPAVPRPDVNATREIFEQFANLGLIYDTGEREDGAICYELQDFEKLSPETQLAVVNYLHHEPRAFWVLESFNRDKSKSGRPSYAHEQEAN